MIPWPENKTASGNYYPGNLVRVTHVLKYMNFDGGEALHAWYERMGKASALEAIRSHWDWCQGMTADAFLERIEPEISKARKAEFEKNRAADIGTTAHKMAERWIRREADLPVVGPEPPEVLESMWAFMAFQDHWKSQGYKVLRTEQYVEDTDQGTAGMLDYLIENPKTGKEVLDLKTSNYILPSHHVQAAKYLEMARRHENIVGARILKIPKKYGEFQVEDVELGDIYNMTKKRRERKSEEQLLSAFAGALAVFRTFGE